MTGAPRVWRGTFSNGGVTWTPQSWSRPHGIGLASLANILIEPDQAIQLREATDPDVVLAVLAPALNDAPQEAKETSHPDSTPARAG